jgi:hypothetical protein
MYYHRASLDWLIKYLNDIYYSVIIIIIITKNAIIVFCSFLTYFVFSKFNYICLSFLYIHIEQFHLCVFVNQGTSLNFAYYCYY